MWGTVKIQVIRMQTVYNSESILTNNDAHNYKSKRMKQTQAQQAVL